MMSDFRESVRNLELFGMRGIRTKKFREASHIKEIEDRLEQQSTNSLASIPSYASLENLLKKLSRHEEISSLEKRNIPFVLFEPRCDMTMFRRAIGMLNVSGKSCIKRLLLVYLMQYGERDEKTKVLAYVLRKMLENNPFQTKDKLLNSGMNNATVFFSIDGLKYVAELINNEKKIDGVLSTLSIPSMLKDCKFIKAALCQYYLTKSYPLENQFSVFESIMSMQDIEGFRSAFPLAADAIIPKIDALKSDKKRKYKESAIAFFSEALGDPRFGYKRLRWNDVSNQSKTIFLHWIAEKDLELFFKIIEETAVDAMWSYRRKFWLKYLPYMSKTWVYFGKQALRFARQASSGNMSYGRLVKGSDPKQSIFAFQIDKFVFTEWSHNGALRAWLEEDTPDVFYKDELDKDKVIMPYPSERWVHSGNDVRGWQSRVEAWLESNCKLDSSLSDVGNNSQTNHVDPYISLW